MIGFVTFLYQLQTHYKGGQMTKPIIRTCENMLSSIVYISEINNLNADGLIMTMEAIHAAFVSR